MLYVTIYCYILCVFQCVLQCALLCVFLNWGEQATHLHSFWGRFVCLCVYLHACVFFVNIFMYCLYCCASSYVYFCIGGTGSLPAFRLGEFSDRQGKARKPLVSLTKTSTRGWHHQSHLTRRWLWKTLSSSAWHHQWPPFTSNRLAILPIWKRCFPLYQWSILDQINKLVKTLSNWSLVLCFAFHLRFLCIGESFSVQRIFYF